MVINNYTTQEPSKELPAVSDDEDSDDKNWHTLLERTHKDSDSSDDEEED